MRRRGQPSLLDGPAVPQSLFQAQAPLSLTLLSDGTDRLSGASVAVAPAVDNTGAPNSETASRGIVYGIARRGLIRGVGDADRSAAERLASPAPYDCLALDLAKKCGFDGPAGSGVADFDPGRLLELTDRHAKIFDTFGQWLAGSITAHAPHVLVLEELVGRGLQGEAARVLPGLRAVALMTARRRELLIDLVNVSAWKPWAKKNIPGWVKSDEGDARAMRAYWLAERAQNVAAV